MLKQTEPIDMRLVLLNWAGKCLQGGPLTIDGYTYEGEEAIQLGYDLVAITQKFERQFAAERRGLIKTK